MIEVEDLYKYYGDKRAIGPLSFSIAAGEIIGLLGLNGAGKTTTLRVLACDLLPSSGSVRVEGLDIVDHPHEIRQKIGYLPDRPPLYDEMTVRAYLTFAARLRGMSGADAARRVPDVEELAQVAAVAHEPIASLSHGYRQRVGIAQAIVHRPRLLVLDEPISGLDPVQIVEMRALLRSLRGEHTIVISSHILAEISETCDRILVVRDGQIGASGTEAELSSQLLSGVRVELTVRGAASAAAEVARGIEGVSRVDTLAAAEPGEDVATLRVEAARDVREALSSALVGAGIGVLELKRSERELESVFLRLAGAGSAGTPAAALDHEGPSEEEQEGKPDDASSAEAGDDDDGGEPESEERGA